MAMTVTTKSFIHNATEGTTGLAADVKAYMDTLTPASNNTVNVTCAGIGNNRVLTLVVVETG
tara:strand:+ start:80 stop:265 length:186 start_codon:yes stop_codon:yes gene_type:complete